MTPEAFNFWTVIVAALTAVINVAVIFIGAKVDPNALQLLQSQLRENAKVNKRTFDGNERLMNTLDSRLREIELVLNRIEKKGP